jgi:hypothetical protein
MHFNKKKTIFIDGFFYGDNLALSLWHMLESRLLFLQNS